MKSSKQFSARSRSALKQGWLDTFGVQFNRPRLGLKSGLLLTLVMVLVAGAATAEWRVRDQGARDRLDDIKNNIGNDGTVIGELKEINTRLAVESTSNESTPEMIEEPEGDEKLDAEQPTAAQAEMDKLCPAGVATTLGQQQRMLCQEMFKTELAQYRFSMRMFERSKENYDRLKEIQDRRNGMEADDYANLQYNTNELLALTALMDNDRDRYRTYMSAYDARVAHIRNARASLTRNALKGSGSPTP